MYKLVKIKSGDLNVFSICYLHLTLILKSISNIMLGIVFSIVPFISLLIPSLLKYNIVSFSWIYSIILVLISFIFLFISSYKLFVEPSKNNMDSFIVSKGASKKILLLTKILAILFLTFCLSIIQSILITITILVFNNSVLLLSYLLITILGQLLFSIIFIPFFTLIATFTKQLIYSLFSFLGLSFIVGTVATPRLINNYSGNSRLEYNGYNGSGFVDVYYGLKTEVIGKGLSNRIFTVGKQNNSQISYVPFYNSLMPGNIALSFYESLFKIGITNTNPIITEGSAIENYNMSLVKFNLENGKSYAEILNPKLDNIFITKYGDQNPFNKTENELYNLLLNKYSDIFELEKNDFWKKTAASLKEAIESKGISNLNTLQKDELFKAINYVISATGEEPILFYTLMFYKTYINKFINISSLKKDILTKSDDHFINIIFSLLEGIDLDNLNLGIGFLINDLSEKQSTNKNLNYFIHTNYPFQSTNEVEYDKLNSYDKKYILNELFKIDNTNIKYLIQKSEGEYSELFSASVLFSNDTLTSTEKINQYLDEVTNSYQETKKLLEDLEKKKYWR